MKKRTKIIAAVVSVAVVASGVGFWLMRPKADSGPTGDVVRIEKPAVGDLLETVNAPGQVEPLNKVAISARVMARIIEMPYLEGATVTKGDPTANPPIPPSVLVRLDSTDLEAGLRSVEARRGAQVASLEVEKSRLAAERAQLEATDATLLKAQQDLHRTQELVKSKDQSQADLDQAQSRYNEIKAQRVAAEMNLKAAETNLTVTAHNLEAADAEVSRASDALNYTTITSPIDGTVTRCYAKVGELAVVGTTNNPGTTIMEVADLSQMLLVVAVDEADIGSIKVGQKARVRIHTYPDEKFEGVVDSIALIHDLGQGGSKYFKTKILLASNDKRIYSGLTADVDIETTKHENVTKVPSQAVLGRPIDDLPLSIRDNNPCIDTKKTYATVVYRFVDGKTAVTPVTVGPSDATHTIVTAGLSSTDSVIVGPYKILEGIGHDKNVQDEREVEKKKQEAARKAEEAKKKSAPSTDSSLKSEKAPGSAAGSTDSSLKVDGLASTDSSSV